MPRRRSQGRTSVSPPVTRNTRSHRRGRDERHHSLPPRSRRRTSYDGSSDGRGSRRAGRPSVISIQQSARNPSEASSPSETTPDPAPPRECICDTACRACHESPTTVCDKHDGLYCSGKCDPRPGHDGRWFHASCIGGTIATAAEGRCLHVPYKPPHPAVFPLHTDTQGAAPWYCLPCWEGEKTRRVETGEKEPSASFASLAGADASDLKQRAERLGYMLKDEELSTRALRKACDLRFKKYVDTLRATVDDDSLVDRILDSRPRAYPTVKPMDYVAREKLRICGRRFELTQIMITIEACACCGSVVPYTSDPWYVRPKDDLSKNYKKLHLPPNFFSDAFPLQLRCHLQRRTVLLQGETQRNAVLHRPACTGARQPRKHSLRRNVGICRMCSDDLKPSKTASVEVQSSETPPSLLRPQWLWCDPDTVAR